MSLFSVRHLRGVLRDEPATLVVDVREPDEYAEVHVAGMSNLPLARVLARDFPAGLGVTPGTELILFCRSGKRSGVAADSLRLAGFSRVETVDGGLLAWEAEGFPVERRPVAAG